MAAKIPKGIGPVFLTGNTCERFKIRPDVELSAQKPYGFVNCKEILNHIQVNGVISDWHCTKAWIEACPDEEILVVIDDENVYGQNFYVCYTTEMKEQELAKYASAVAATPDGVPVGEDGVPVEEEKEDEVLPHSYCRLFCARNFSFLKGPARAAAAAPLGRPGQRVASRLARGAPAAATHRHPHLQAEGVIRSPLPIPRRLHAG
jgi:hypothetical protein